MRDRKDGYVDWKLGPNIQLNWPRTYYANTLFNSIIFSCNFVKYTIARKFEAHVRVHCWCVCASFHNLVKPVKVLEITPNGLIYNEKYKGFHCCTSLKNVYGSFWPHPNNALATPFCRQKVVLHPPKRIVFTPPLAAGSIPARGPIVALINAAALGSV
jgi:hypothetical protein